MGLCAGKKGITAVYGYFADDESNYLFLKLSDDGVEQIYEIPQDAEGSDFNDDLLDLEYDDMMLRIAGQYG